jgi:hypothetical protein
MLHLHNRLQPLIVFGVDVSDSDLQSFNRDLVSAVGTWHLVVVKGLFYFFRSEGSVNVPSLLTCLVLYGESS